jgi:Flp pilus assembly protein TadG
MTRRARRPSQSADAAPTPGKAPGTWKDGMNKLATVLGTTIRRCTRGSALVEMALVTPLLLILFSAMFEFGRMFHTRLTARHAVIEATRYAVTGNQLTDPDTGDPIDRATSIKQILAERAYTLPVVPDAVTITPADGGGPEEVVTVTLTYTYDYAMPGFMDVLPAVQFTVAAAMRNEPYFEASGS